MSQASLGGAQRLRASVDRMGEATALVWQDHEISYEELWRRLSCGAGALAELGVTPGARVGLVLGNVPAFVEAWYAILHLGAIAVPLNPGLAADELRHALDNAGVTAVLAGPTVLDAVLGVAHEVSGLGTVIAVGRDAPDGTAGRWNELRDAAEPGPMHDPAGGEVATIVYTSGTTGRPRGAMLTHAQLGANQDQSLAGRVRTEQDDRVLVVLPISHIYALNVGLAATLLVGATVVLQERFDPTTTRELIQQAGVTVLLGAPPMYAAWLGLDLPDDTFDGVRVAVSGAAGLPKTTFDGFRDRFGIVIHEGYGLTEAAPSVTSNAMAPEPRAGSIGKPLPHIEVRLVDTDGEDVEDGDPGELLVRGPNVFAGYWQDDEATARAIDPDGWLHTGDVAVRDEDGYLILVDRRDDLILVSGFNVYPREVERVLVAHQSVAEAAVIGVPHPYTGQAVKAWVVARQEVTEDELSSHCLSLLARYKCPDAIVLVDELPRTATGKIQRAALRQTA